MGPLRVSYIITTQAVNPQLELSAFIHYGYLTYMQSTPCKIPGWMKHKLESRLPGEISIPSDMQMTPPL